MKQKLNIQSRFGVRVVYLSDEEYSRAIDKCETFKHIQTRKPYCYVYSYAKYASKIGQYL